MQENDDERNEKQPIDMTSEELLDYAIAPEVAERLKALCQDDPSAPRTRTKNNFFHQDGRER